MFGKVHEKQRAARAVRDAIDSYPGGLCFSTTDGRPILVNKTMNSLVSALTGGTVMNADSVWAALGTPGRLRGGTYLNSPWFPVGQNGLDNGDRLYFMLPDGRVWRFQRRIIAGEAPCTVQTEASDVTELYRLSKELYENNIRLAGLHQRQRDLLANIVQINQEKELLATKTRVHDEFGRCLIATKRSLSGGTLNEDVPALSLGWESAIRDLTNIPLSGAQSETPPEAELLQVADMIGCRVDFSGAQPTERKALLLLFAAVREALTNAVRHAGADRLKVSISRNETGWHAEISNNGSARPSFVKEGDGLGNLRRRLEQEGAEMRVVCGSRGVVLEVDIPEEGTLKEGEK